MKKFLFMFLAVVALCFSACQKDFHPCDNITCYNNGTCVNGDCQCVNGYRGRDCSIDPLPKSVTISKIVVTNYPVLGLQNTNWDSGSTNGDEYADIFVAMNKVIGSDYNANLNDFESSNYYQNVSTVRDLEFSNNSDFPFAVTEIKEHRMLSIWDYDANIGVELMNEVVVDFAKIYDEEGETPIITIEDSGVIGLPATYKIHVSWIF